MMRKQRSYEMQAPDSLTRSENPNPKWPVPKDLIELQPSYKPDTWDPDWQSTSSCKVSYLVQRLKEIQVTCLQPICQTSKGSDAQRDEGILSLSHESLSFHSKRQRKEAVSHFLYNDTWVQCEACRKWRKISDGSEPDATVAWFFSMNADPLFQSCKVPEESWDSREPITYLPGFCSKGTLGGLAENVSFFTSILQEHYVLMDSQTKKALTWLARLSPEKLAEMETFGLICPCILSSGEAHRFQKLFKAFGLVRKVVQGVHRWIYPHEIGVFKIACSC